MNILNTKHTFAFLTLMIVLISVLLLSSCKDKASSEELGVEDATDQTLAENNVKVDVGSGEPNGTAVSEEAAAQGVTEEVTEEAAPVREDIKNKDDAAKKLPKLDDPLDEIQKNLDDLADEVVTGEAKFSRIKYDQVSTKLGKEVKQLNQDISTLTNLVYDNPNPDFAMVTTEYYALSDRIAAFYETAAKDLDDLQHTSGAAGKTTTTTSSSTSSTNTTTEEAALEVEVSSDCVDTDGTNFNQKGITSGLYFTGSAPPKAYEDICAGINLEKVYEYYCENNKVKRMVFTCPNGCENSVCK